MTQINRPGAVAILTNVKCAVRCIIARGNDTEPGNSIRYMM